MQGHELRSVNQGYAKPPTENLLSRVPRKHWLLMEAITSEVTVEGEDKNGIQMKKYLTNLSHQFSCGNVYFWARKYFSNKDTLSSLSRMVLTRQSVSLLCAMKWAEEKGDVNRKKTAVF